MKNNRNLNILAQEFEDCQEVLAAIGDKTRQAIIITLISAGCASLSLIGYFLFKMLKWRWNILSPEGLKGK